MSWRQGESTGEHARSATLGGKNAHHHIATLHILDGIGQHGVRRLEGRLALREDGPEEDAEQLELLRGELDPALLCRPLLGARASCAARDHPLQAGSERFHPRE